MADEQDPQVDEQPSQGAGAAALDDAAGTQDAGQQDTSQQDDSQQGGDDDSQAAAAPTLTADDIAAALVKAGIGQPQQATQQDQKGWTQEDFDNAFKVIKVTPQDVAMIRAALAEGGKDEDLIAALQPLLQGSARQAAAIADYQMKLIQQQLLSQITPLHRYMSAQNEQAARVEFFEKYKDLKPYEPLVEAIVQKVKETGFKGTKQQGFEFVAKQARAVIAGLPNGKPAAGQQQQTTQQPAKPSKMSALSTGGGQGGAGRGQSGGKKSPGAAVFD